MNASLLTGYNEAVCTFWERKQFSFKTKRKTNEQIFYLKTLKIFFCKHAIKVSGICRLCMTEIPQNISWKLYCVYILFLFLVVVWHLVTMDDWNATKHILEVILWIYFWMFLNFSYCMAFVVGDDCWSVVCTACCPIC